MHSPLPVLDSAAFVVSRAKRVSFHPQAVPAAVENWGASIHVDLSWNHPCHITCNSVDAVQWFFVLDVLNHCFWPDVGSHPWTVDYNGESYSGYWGLAASLKKAMEKGVPVIAAGYLASISEDDAHGIFHGRGVIPMLGERVANLREAGRVLLSRWSGRIIHLLDAAHRNVLELVPLIVNSFPSFRDEALYEGRRVYFWKRAQLFASDIHHACSGTEWGALHNVNELTAFADYKLPQVLRELGILQYDNMLERQVSKRRDIVSQSREEIEIRAATIWAVEQLKEEFHRQGHTVNSARVDNWLWSLGQLDTFRSEPYHRCRTIYY